MDPTVCSKITLLFITQAISRIHGFPQGYANFEYGSPYSGSYSQGMMPQGMYPSFGAYGQSSPLTGSHGGHIMDISTQGQHVADPFGYSGHGHVQRPFGIPNAIGNTIMGMNSFPGSAYPGFYGAGVAGGHGYPLTGGYGSGTEPFMGSHANVGPFGSGTGSFSSDLPFGGYGPVYGSNSPFGGPSYGGSNSFGGDYHGSRPSGLPFAAATQSYSGARTGLPGRPNQASLSEERNGRTKVGSTDAPEVNGNKTNVYDKILTYKSNAKLPGSIRDSLP